MGLETATYIHELDSSNPIGSADPKSQGDDHIRLIKSALQSTFPNVEGTVTATHTELSNVGAGKFSDGTVGSPGIAFAADPDNGAYRIGTNRYAFSVGGVKQFEFGSSATNPNIIYGGSSTSDNALAIRNLADTLDLLFVRGDGALLAIDGALATPAYTFITDTDLGMYRVGANQLGLRASVSMHLTTPLLQANGIHNGTAPTGAANQYVASGTYTPTITNVSNVTSSSSASGFWIRVGNVVSVFGRVTVDPTAASTRTVIGVSLPIASALTDPGDLSGTHSTLIVGGTPSPAADSGMIFGDTTNDRAQFDWISGMPDQSSRAFHFGYLVKD